MKTRIFEVENIKCGGCEGRIKRALGEILGVEAQADASAGTVEIKAPRESEMREALMRLEALGFPEKSARLAGDEKKKAGCCGQPDQARRVQG